MNPLRNRVRTVLACLGGLIWQGAAAQPADSGGLLGTKLAAVEKSSDFFTFFNFASIGEKKLPDGSQITSFKPTGDAFRALVTLNVTTDGRGIITQLELRVARSFIDDRSKCIYAADLAKSFLGSAARAGSDDAIGALATEISARAMSGSSVTILNAQPLPPAPVTPSPAYRTYAGDAQPQALLYPSGLTELSLRNVTETGGPVLEFTVSAKK